MGARIMLLAWMAVVMAFPGPSWGALSTNVVVPVNVPMAASAQLTISPTVINFPDADPDTVPSIAANANPVQVTASATTGANRIVTLTALAQGDLVSGSSTININNVTWTATGTGFRAGTMSRTAAQLAGRWRGPGTRTGTLSFFLNNSWSYGTGNYTQTVTFTLTAP